VVFKIKIIIKKIKIIQLNSLFIYELSLVTGGQLQCQHEDKKQQQHGNTGKKQTKN
jgi:hypothetical protein